MIGCTNGCTQLLTHVGSCGHLSPTSGPFVLPEMNFKVFVIMYLLHMLPTLTNVLICSAIQIILYLNIYLCLNVVSNFRSVV